jgi:hypothetical protein
MANVRICVFAMDIPPVVCTFQRQALRPVVDGNVVPSESFSGCMCQRVASRSLEENIGSATPKMM